MENRRSMDTSNDTGKKHINPIPGKFFASPGWTGEGERPAASGFDKEALSSIRLPDHINTAAGTVMNPLTREIMEPTPEGSVA